VTIDHVTEKLDGISGQPAELRGDIIAAPRATPSELSSNCERQGASVAPKLHADVTAIRTASRGIAECTRDLVAHAHQSQIRRQISTQRSQQTVAALRGQYYDLHPRGSCP